MQNVYLDPNSYVHLNNVFFAKDDRYNINNCREPFIFLKEYCFQRDITLQTIDLWDSARATPSDIYVSFDHKFFPRKWYWRLRNNRYPMVNPNRFARKILFQFEPPVVAPEIKYLINATLKIYDKVFFTWETGVPGIHYFHTPLHIPDAGIIPDYWVNANRKFLTLINSNRRMLSYHKELLTERIRAIIFFGKKGEIDLYGRDWDKPLPFPYWFHKRAVQKVYKGTVANKYEKLSEYNFAFGIENCQLPGYITDKIFDCFYVGTVPIYLGDPEVEKYISKDCFIDMNDFKNYHELRKFLKSLTESDIKTYKDNARLFLDSEKVKPFTKEYFSEIFVNSVLN